MRVIFLDFDGVLNSEGSFLYENKRRNRYKEHGVKGPVNQTLCNVCTSNFQMILDKYRDVQIVISSTWRELFTIEWLKEKLESYHISSARVIGHTPSDPGGNRGLEIATWLNNNPDVTHYIVIDDNEWGIPQLHGYDRFVKTTWESGLTFEKALEAMEKISNKSKKLIGQEEEEE